MSSPRPLSFIPAALLGVLLLCPLLVRAQQQPPVPPPPPSEAGGKKKPAAPGDVPMFDTPPRMALPAPKPVKPTPAPSPPREPAGSPAEKGKSSPGAKAAEPPLPAALRPVKPTLPPAAADANATSTSTHGEFVVHGADLESRTYITQVCEEEAEEVALLLRDPEPFGIPIVVSVKTPPNVAPGGPAVGTDIAQLAYGGFRLQITIQVRPDFAVNDFRAELVRMLMAQRILRGNKELTTKRTRILPDWLLVGVKEALRYRNRSRPSAVFASVFRTGKVYGVEEILETSPGSLDSLSRTLYETSCCALVLALLDQPEGNLRMAKFLNALATDSKSDREMLNHWFPGINASKSSLNKWWSLQMASLATPTVFESLGPSETAKELDKALQLHYQTTPSEVPAAPLVAANDTELNADAEKEAKKRGFFARLFSGDKSDKPDEEAPAKGKGAAEAKPKPQEEKPKAEPKKASKPESKEEKSKEEKPKDKPAAEEAAKPGLRLRNLFGFGSAPAEAEGDKKEAKPEPKKEAKPEPKKEAKPESKKETKPEPKKEAKPEPKKETKPEGDDETKKQPGFFGRMFKGKSEARKEGDDEKKTEQPEEKAKSTDKPKDAPKKDKATDKPAAASFENSLMLRALADASVPGFSIAFNAAQWLQADQPRYALFPFFGKKKDDDSTAAPEAPPAKKEEKKPEPKKEEPKPKAEEPKKVKLVAVTIPLSEYSRILKRSDAKDIFSATALNLAALSPRAHPLFRPLIRDYIELVADISRHKAKDADARIKALKERRDQVLAQAKAVRDYLDWYEASESNDYSGSFDDYLRLPKIIDQEIPRRNDPISKLLDDVEKQAEE